MAAKIQDVVKANLVVVGLRLLSTPAEFEAFKLAVNTDVQIAGTSIIANIPSGVTEPGRILTLDRDRITLELSPSRSIVSRDYPLREDLHRLSEVASRAIHNTPLAGQQPRAFGFNVELVFDQDSEMPAFGYLSRRLFDAGSLGNEGWQLVGGAGTLIFNDNGRRWTIKLEPRFNNETEARVFLTVNLHMEGQPLPNEEGIRDSFNVVWNEIHGFVERLDRREVGYD